MLLRSKTGSIDDSPATGGMALHKETIQEACTGCRACEQACPRACIVMRFAEDGFLYPAIDRADCTGCRQCEAVCHARRVFPQNDADQLEGYYGWHQDAGIRAASSSGGAFSAITEQWLDVAGVVFGARYSDTFDEVYHSRAGRHEIGVLRKAKYVASDLRHTFSEAAEALSAGKRVLYVGTPCQIAGLKAFLRDKDAPGLLTLDFVCHGVCSMDLLNRHMAWVGKGAPVKRLDLRSHRYGWDTHCMAADFTRGKSYLQPGVSDFYFQAFLRNKALRRSCYQCVYANRRNRSDITLGDFWGIRRMYPRRKHREGISLVVANTRKGAEEAARLDTMRLTELQWEAFHYIYGVRNWPVRERMRFFAALEEQGYDHLAEAFRWRGRRQQAIWRIMEAAKGLRGKLTVRE